MPGCGPGRTRVAPFGWLLRQRVDVGGTPRLTLICVGGGETSLRGRGRLLDGVARALEVVLASMAGAEATGGPLMAVEAGMVASAPYGGLTMLWQSRRASSAWMLALIGRMLNASRVGVAVPGKPGALLYSEWAAEGVDPADGAESASDDPREARRALAAAVAVRDAPVQGRDLPRDLLAKAADSSQILGVPFPPHGGDRGALLLFRNADSAFEPLDVEAAVLLVDRLAGAGALDDGRINIESVQAAEWRRIAGELHDGPVQQLTGAAMEMEVAIKLQDRDARSAGRSMHKSRDEVRRVIAQLRTLIFDLRLANVSELGFVDALKEYAQEFARTNGLALDLRVDGSDLRLPSAVEQSLFLVAREGLINVEKHARATAIRVVLDVQEDVITLRVEDNGVGFPVEQTIAGAGQERHYGLLGLRERADRLHGNATIVSQPNVGTIVEVSIPRPERAL